MLQKSIYKALPYLYVVVGLLCMLFIDSTLVFFPSILLISVAALVLWMRYRNSVDPVEYIEASSVANDEYLEHFLDENSDLPDHERRFGDQRDFPLVDDNDVMIPFDRRSKKSDKAD